MFSIRKASAEDFELVYPLFQDFRNPAITREDWKRIFVSPWKPREEFCGYLLVRDDQVKGFLGLIFSERLLDGKSENFCNMTSWIVDEDCRGQSLLLLLELMKLNNYTLTNFTASPTVATVLSKFGFRTFPIDQRVLLPIPAGFQRRVTIDCEFAPDIIANKLTGEELRIFQDHQALNCQHLLLRSGDGDCYIVLKRTVRKHVPFAKVHYLGNLNAFRSSIESQIVRICVHLKVFGMMVDERYIQGYQFKGSAKYPHQGKGYFKSNSEINENQIDTIYSELVLVHN